MDPPPDYIRIVIDKAHRLIIVKCAVVLYIPDDHLSGVPRAIDQNPPTAAELPQAMIVETTDQTTPPHKENQKKGVDDKDRQRVLAKTEDPMNQNVKHDCAG